MLKTELIQRISSQNPHLYQRDVEKIVDAILDQITEALARGDRVELAAILALELPSRSHRKPCPSSRLEKECESDLIRKLRCRLSEYCEAPR
jgi:integration host factor subunit beta